MYFVKKRLILRKIPCYFSAFAFLLINQIFVDFPSLSAQTLALPQESEVVSKLAKAREHIVTYNNDSVKLLLQPLIPRLESQGTLNERLGLHVQLTLAWAMEHDDQDSLATIALLSIKEKSEEKGYWDVYATASLVLANLYETIGKAEQSKDNLEGARFAMAQQKLDSIYPFFSIRLSSWHRIYGNRDSAIFYAEETLRTSLTYNQPLGKATGHLLMGLLSKDDYKKAVGHFEQAAHICDSINDYVGESYNYGNITRLYTQNNEPTLALRYNDSTIVASHKAIEQGYETHRTLFQAYKNRATIYEQLGSPDSVSFYLRKGYEMEIDNIQESERLKVLEIDAKYNDEKKAQLLATQAQQLTSERARRQLIGLLAASIFVFAIILIYYYLKLQKASKKNEFQAQQLRQLDQAKSRFFANVSHELRTPLTLMTGPINTLLQEKNLTNQQLTLLEMADRNGYQLSQLINEILDLQKLEVGKLKINTEPVVLYDFFLQYMSQFESLAFYRNIEYSYDIDINHELVALIDREKCRQILYNLLSNAFKYTPHQGKVSLHIRVTSDGQIDLTVTDTGPGIHPEDLPHIFDRYFQTNRPEERAEGGTGIGLALCKEYTRLLQGQIKVESKLGIGTTFNVSFPLTITLEFPKNSPSKLQELKTIAPTPAQNNNPPIINGKIEHAKPKLLIVEDNIDLQRYIRLILSTKYDIIHAHHGKDALKAIEEHPNIQLVISDLMMPVMDGYQLLNYLKSSDPTRHIPVIMLTARAEFSDRLKALRIGVDDYMTKPFRQEELLVRVENLLKNQVVRQIVWEEDTAPEDNQAVMSIPDQEWLTLFEAYVKANLSNDLLSVPYLADEFAMSKSTLLRQLKRLTGLSPKQYLTEVRLEEARRLLENRSFDSISALANHVGYKDSRSFSRSFKKKFQKLPSEV